ncbi:MAG: protein translocase subunit SecD [Candidatus Buchananbacteria bacterium]
MSEKRNQSSLWRGPRANLRWKIVGIIVLAVISGSLVYPKYWDNSMSWLNNKLGWGLPQFSKINWRLGLDLVGGTHLIYEADTSKISESDKNSSLEGVRDVVERRVNAFGVAEPIVQTQKAGEHWRVIVDLAGIKDVNEAIKQIGETPLLEFKEQGETALTVDQRKEIDTYNLSAETKAKDLLKKVLVPGADFSALAKQYSEDAGSKDTGGDLGFAKKGQFVPEFEKVLFDQLTDGKIYPQLVKTDFGYHIIKRLATKGTGDTLEVNGAHILIKTKSANDYAIGEWRGTNLTGKNLKKALVQFESNTNAPQVSLEFDAEGAKLFAEITTRNVGKPVAIFLDGTPISTPNVEEPITDGKAVISGQFGLTEAKRLAQRLNAGALPVPIKLVSQQTIGASLGAKALQQSIKAGLIGMAIVAVFMLAVYFLPGFLAVLALLIYAAVVLAIFKLSVFTPWPITLTLSGIAGFILSVGMAVDANVLIFERTKEELRRGKPTAIAIDEGFKRAWTSIRDSNISSLITCAVLMWFGSSIIKGFAITLAIGILVSIFSAIFITRQFIRLISNWQWTQHHRLYGVRRKTEQQ